MFSTFWSHSFYLEGLSIVVSLLALSIFSFITWSRTHCLSIHGYRWCHSNQVGTMWICDCIINVYHDIIFVRLASLGMNMPKDLKLLLSSFARWFNLNFIMQLDCPFNCHVPLFFILSIFFKMQCETSLSWNTIVLTNSRKKLNSKENKKSVDME